MKATYKLDLTWKEMWLLKDMARSHVNKLEADAEFYKGMDGCENTVKTLNEKIEKTYALWEKIENEETQKK